MRKALIVIIIIIMGAGGYLGWDGYDKTKNQKLQPGITLYSWTDAAGNKYFFGHTAAEKRQKCVQGQRV